MSFKSLLDKNKKILRFWNLEIKTIDLSKFLRNFFKSSWFTNFVASLRKGKNTIFKNTKLRKKVLCSFFLIYLSFLQHASYIYFLNKFYCPIPVETFGWRVAWLWILIGCNSKVQPDVRMFALRRELYSFPEEKRSNKVAFYQDRQQFSNHRFIGNSSR